MTIILLSVLWLGLGFLACFLKNKGNKEKIRSNMMLVAISYSAAAVLYVLLYGWR